MATSGSTDFTLTTLEIIQRAAKIAGILAEGESLTAEQQQDGIKSLNLMVKHWQADGLHLWRKTEAVLFLEASQAKYVFGTANACLESDFIETTLSADAASGASTISVTSATGLASADFLGIELDDGTVQWTTINGAPSGTTVTPTATLTGAASSGNAVYTYTTKLSFPLRMLQARVRYSADSEIDLIRLSREEYFELPNRTSAGTPTQVYFDRQLDTRNIYLWPVPDDEVKIVRFTFERVIEDFDANANTADLPQEWLRAVVWGLADEMCDEYDVMPAKADRIAIRAGVLKKQIMGFDREDGAVVMEIF